MKGALVAAPSQNAAPGATLAWVAGTADPNYPITNLQTLAPDVVAKTTGAGSATLRATLSSAEALQGIALINTNLGDAAITVTNNGGLASTPLEIPATEDGLCRNGYVDLRSATGATASQWTIAITGAPAPIAIGTLLLVRAWTLLRVRWDWSLIEKHPVIEHRTGYGARLQYQIPVRVRRWKATALDAAQRNVIRTIARDARGSIVPWPLVPDVDDDAVLLVQFVADEREEVYRIGYGSFRAGTAIGNVDTELEVEEANAGIAL